MKHNWLMIMSRRYYYYHQHYYNYYFPWRSMAVGLCDVQSAFHYYYWNRELVKRKRFHFSHCGAWIYLQRAPAGAGSSSGDLAAERSTETRDLRGAERRYEQWLDVACHDCRMTTASVSPTAHSRVQAAPAESVTAPLDLLSSRGIFKCRRGVWSFWSRVPKHFFWVGSCAPTTVSNVCRRISACQSDRFVTNNCF